MGPRVRLQTEAGAEGFLQPSGAAANRIARRVLFVVQRVVATFPDDGSQRHFADHAPWWTVGLWGWPVDGRDALLGDLKEGPGKSGQRSVLCLHGVSVLQDLLPSFSRLSERTNRSTI